MISYSGLVETPELFNYTLCGGVSGTTRGVFIGGYDQKGKFRSKELNQQSTLANINQQQSSLVIIGQH